MSGLKNNLTEWLLAIGLSSNLLGYLFGSFSYVKFILLSCILLQLLINVSSRGFKIIIHKKIWLFFTFTLILLLYSYIRFDYATTSNYFTYFLLYAGFAIIFINGRIDFISLLEKLSIILFLSIYLVITAFRDNPTIGYLLGLSYNFLPAYLSSLFLLVFYRKKLPVSTFFVLLLNLIIYTFFFISKGNRGIILLIVLYCFSKYLFKKSSTVIGKLAKLVLIIFSSSIILNFEKFLLTLSNLLSKLGITVHALEKTVTLLYSGDSLDNGRLYIINRLFSLTTHRQLISGLGVGSIEELVGTYSHNVFVQYLFEGGVFYLAILIFVLYYLIKQCKLDSVQNEIFRIALFAVLGQLMLSNVYWLSPFYWYILYLALSKNSKGG